MADKLDALIAYLDALPERPGLDELAAILSRLELTRADLVKWVRFSDRSYQRNLVRAADHFHLWVLCWRNGQQSPIHDHAGSACGVRIIEGTATVTLFDRAKDNRIEAAGSEQHTPGQVVVSADDDMHQVSNLQAETDLITLHVYTPPLLNMHTFTMQEPSHPRNEGELIGGICL